MPRACAVMLFIYVSPLAGLYYFTDRRHQVPAFQPRPGNLHLQALQRHFGIRVSRGQGHGPMSVVRFTPLPGMVVEK